jgi:hypothetical protein
LGGFMFIIFWRGIGFIVPVFSVVAFFLAIVLSGTLGHYGIPERWSGLLGFAITSSIAAGLIWYIAIRVGGRSKRILVDAATGREITIKGDGGSFMFIPTRFWAFIVLGIGLFFGYAVNTPPVDDSTVIVVSDPSRTDADAPVAASSDSALATQ